MKNMFYAVCALVLWGMLAVVPVKAEEPSAVAEKAAVKQMFRDYVAALIDDGKPPVAAFFNQPAVTLPLNRLIATPADAEKWAEDIRPGFQKKGYAQFVPEQMSVKLLGKDIALLSYSGERKTKDGTFIEKSAGTLVYKKTDAGWKIVSILPHPVEDTIKFD